MTLHLRQSDVRRLARLQEALLSPLDGDGAAAWSERVLDATGALFASDRPMVVVPSADGVIHRWGEALEPFSDVLEGMVTSVGPGVARYRHEDLDEALGQRRSAGLSVWTNAMVADLLDRDATELSFYHDFLVPAGTLHGGAMSVQLPMGEAMVGTTPGPAARPLFGDEWLDVLRLALPAFRAGARAVSGLRAAGARLAGVLDALGLAAVVLDGRGREVHRTPAMARLLEDDPEREDLAAVTRRIGGRVAAGRRAGDRVEGPGSRTFRTRSSRYEVRAVRLPASVAGRGDLAIATVERLTPALPHPRSLQKRFGLTRREAEVALILARGATNEDAAERLGISPHTVRTHAERIFAKLGIRTRKALALRLLEEDTPGAAGA